MNYSGKTMPPSGLVVPDNHRRGNPSADGAGFEPAVSFPTHAFQASAIDHSATHPLLKATESRDRRSGWQCSSATNSNEFWRQCPPQATQPDAPSTPRLRYNGASHISTMDADDPRAFARFPGESVKLPRHPIARPSIPAAPARPAPLSTGAASIAQAALPCAEPPSSNAGASTGESR